MLTVLKGEPWFLNKGETYNSLTHDTVVATCMVPVVSFRLNNIDLSIHGFLDSPSSAVYELALL